MKCLEAEKPGDSKQKKRQKEARGEGWKVRKRRRGRKREREREREREIIIDPETEEGIDRHKEKKRQTQPRRYSHRCGERKQGEQEQWTRSYLELPASLGVGGSCSLACSPECLWALLS